MIGVASKTHLKKQDWEFVFTKLHLRIGPMTILVLHQAVPTFHNKIAPVKLYSQVHTQRGAEGARALSLTEIA